MFACVYIAEYVRVILNLDGCVSIDVLVFTLPFFFFVMHCWPFFEKHRPGSMAGARRTCCQVSIHYTGKNTREAAR